MALLDTLFSASETTDVDPPAPVSAPAADSASLEFWASIAAVLEAVTLIVPPASMVESITKASAFTGFSSLIKSCPSTSRMALFSMSEGVQPTVLNAA